MDERNLNIQTVDTNVLELIFNKSIQKDLGQAEEVSVADYATKSFLYYAASVIAGRAIPDLRDGMKHGQRRTLYTMKHDLGLSHTGSFKKSARVVGSVIGLYHPHGDVAAYEALVNLAQGWKKNLTLADGQGNWGSIDGSNAAAARYTEVRLTPASSLMFTDINDDTVDYIPNYDSTEKEPVVLPVPYPNILINGAPAGSIAVGMATSILPHNSTEIMNAMLRVLNNRKDGKETTIAEFLELVPGPDFPTGGFLYQTEKMAEYYESGRGSVRLRAKHHVEDLKRGKTAIIIDEIPWGKTKMSLIGNVVDLKKMADKTDKMANSIITVNDESDKRNGLRISIELKAGSDPEVVWNYILKNTELDTSHSYFNVVLDQVENSAGEISSAPREYGVLKILEKYVDFREEYFVRKYESLVKGYLARLHILEGLLRAIDMIDDIIGIVRGADNITDAKERLMDIDYSIEQAEAIVAMRLGRLTKLPRQEFLDEQNKLNELYSYSNSIINDKMFMYVELIKETEEVAKKIASPRKTIIKPELSGMNLEDIIPKEDCVIYITNKGYVKRVSAKEISNQNRGTQGKRGITLTEGDFVEKIFHTSTHSVIMFIMSSGQIYGTKAYNVPDSNRGSFIENIFETEEGESIVNVLEVEDFNDKNIILVTENGTVKSSSLDLYQGCLRKPGIKGIKLKDDDEVISAKVVEQNSEDEIVIATKVGNAIRFKISEISVTGRSSSGVRGIRLKDGNKVIGSSILSKDTIVATVTENGMVKLSEASEFKIQARAGLGVKCMDLTKKSGSLISILSWDNDSDFDIVTITKDGVLNRINTKEIRKTSRKTKGVKLIDLRDNDSLVSVLKAEKEVIAE